MKMPKLDMLSLVQSKISPESFAMILEIAISMSAQFTNQENVTVSKNKTFLDDCGIEREFDLYWEYELAGVTYKTVIDCKSYSSKVTSSDIGELMAKAKDIPDLKLTFATTKGFHWGATTKAKRNDIGLLFVGKQNPSDWITFEGVPLGKTGTIGLVVNRPVEIIRLQPRVDGDWIMKNIRNFNPSKLAYLEGEKDQIFIEDVKNSKTYSIKELESKLKPRYGKSHGMFQKFKHYKHAYLVLEDNVRLKLNSLEIHYRIDKPIKKTIEIDFENELIGVVNYLEKGHDKLEFADGIDRT